MNKNKLVVSMLSFAMVFALSLPSSVSAFWPFDGFYNKGEVKAAVIDGNVINTKVNTGDSDSVKLYKSLKQMKSVCTDLFAVNIGTPKLNIPGDKKLDTETKYLMNLMKNLCKQVDTYSYRLSKVMPEPELTPPTSTPSANAPKTIICGGISAKACPTGYSCVMNSKTPDASGVCVQKATTKRSIFEMIKNK